MNRHGRYDQTFLPPFDRIWKGLCGIIVIWLWQLRNQAVFQGILKQEHEHLEFIWEQSRAQIATVAEFERRHAMFREEGIRLQISLKCLYGQQPAPDSSHVTSPRPSLTVIDQESSTMLSKPILHAMYIVGKLNRLHFTTRLSGKIRDKVSVNERGMPT